MKLAWRGVVDADGDIAAWPMLLFDHNQAFAVLPHLRNCRVRWRQWNPDGPVDFDDAVSAKDQALVEEWVKNA